MYDKLKGRVTKMLNSDGWKALLFLHPYSKMYLEMIVGNGVSFRLS